MRRASRELEVPRSTVWKTLLKRLCMKPYKLQLLHQLKPNDKQQRYEFCSRVQQVIDEDENFLVRIKLEELKRRIEEVATTVSEDMLQRVWQEFDYRVDICRVTRGSHIEGL